MVNLAWRNRARRLLRLPKGTANGEWQRTGGTGDGRRQSAPLAGAPALRYGRPAVSSTNDGLVSAPKTGSLKQKAMAKMICRFFMVS